MRHCSATTKAGKPCKSPAGARGLCFFHGNPEKAHTLGQIGGRKNRSRQLDLPPNRALNTVDLCNILAEAIYDVRSNKISPRQAGALSQLCNSYSRVLPNADIQEWFTRIERQLAERESAMIADTGPGVSAEPDESVDRVEEQLSDDQVQDAGDGVDGARFEDDGQAEVAERVRQTIVNTAPSISAEHDETGGQIDQQRSDNQMLDAVDGAKCEHDESPKVAERESQMFMDPTTGIIAEPDETRGRIEGQVSGDQAPDALRWFKTRRR